MLGTSPPAVSAITPMPAELVKPPAKAVRRGTPSERSVSSELISQSPPMLHVTNDDVANPASGGYGGAPMDRHNASRAEPVGPVDGEMGFVLVKHACIVGALASRLPADVDIAPSSLRRSMDTFVTAARKRVRELQTMAPEHALSVLTQIFAFEGLRRREHQESVEKKERQAVLDGLQGTVDRLEAELREKTQETQLLREAVLEVQTNANKQVLDARSLQRACEREIARQAAELAKLTQQCDSLKQQVEQAESKAARMYLQQSNAVGGSVTAAMMLRRAAAGSSGRGGGLSGSDGGLTPETGMAASAPPAALDVLAPKFELPPQSGNGNGNGNGTSPLRSNGLDSTRTPSRVLTPTDAQPALKPPPLTKTGGSRHSSQRVMRVGFEIDPGDGGGGGGTSSLATPSKQSATDDRRSPIESDGASPTLPASAGGMPSLAGKAGTPLVPTEAYVEQVYMQLGGQKDRSNKLPASSVLRHLERTYDDLGDPHRFSRIIGKKANFSFDEFGLVLLQVARL